MNLRRLGREKLLLGGTIVCLALFGLDRLLLTPVLAAWATRAEEIRRLRLANTQGADTIAQESAWLRWRDETKAKLLPAVPGDAESALLSRVDTWARSSGFNVSSLRPRWKEGAAQARLLELQVAGTGSPGAVTGFLYQLETSPVALAVEQLELVPRNPDGNELALDLRLSGLCPAATGKARRAP
jgi:hypothetical protein